MAVRIHVARRGTAIPAIAPIVSASPSSEEKRCASRAVGEHECLPVVARLKQLLDTTMQRHDEWFRLGNHWVVLVASDGQVQPHRAVDRGC